MANTYITNNIVFHCAPNILIVPLYFASLFFARFLIERPVKGTMRTH